MLYHLLVPLADDYAFFNVFRYLTFRSGAAVLTALLFGFLFGKPIIRWLRSLQRSGQPIRSDGPESHLLTKQGTPTMGGLMMLIGIVLATLLWADLANPYIWIVLMVTVGFGLIGFADDYKKLRKRSHRGVPGRVRLLLEFLIAGVAAYWTMTLSLPAQADAVAIPFFKEVLFNLGWFYIAFAALVIVGASNAVNLTDGLDGLAIVPVMITAGCFVAITYLVGNAVYSEYLQLHPVPGSGELVIICASVIGAGLGFLWWNAPPAQVFMGDTGSLSLGGLLGAVSVIAKHEIVLAIIGGLFVIETLSVIIQVYYFKMTGRRVFLMAPIHHHFEKKGWSEPTIVIRFWIISVIFALIGLSTLKLR